MTCFEIHNFQSDNLKTQYRNNNQFSRSEVTIGSGVVINGLKTNYSAIDNTPQRNVKRKVTMLKNTDALSSIFILRLKILDFYSTMNIVI